jgi:hypothetical protein
MTKPKYSVKEPIEKDNLEGWQTLLKKDGFDEGGRYKVVDPRSIYLGKSGSDLATDWFNWYISAHADKRNSGPVVFLRSQGLPNKITGAYISDVPGQESATGRDTSRDDNITDPDYPIIYVNDPNIRIGNDRLQIFQDQAVFFPIITAYRFASVVPYRDWGNLQDHTGLTIDYGDNPPETSQLTINNEDIKLPPKLGMEDFRISTPIFTAVVPDAPYGTSIKDFLDDGPIAPGSYPAMVDGYFVMLQFSPGRYLVHCWASAGREVKGPYFSELLYEIEVRERGNCNPHGRITTWRPARNEGVLNRTLNKKREIGELTDVEVNRIKMIQNRVNNTLRP